MKNDGAAIPEEEKMMATTYLNDGTEVLAHANHGHPKHYVNRTQATRAAAEVGGRVHQPRLGPAFYVAVRA